MQVVEIVSKGSYHIGGKKVTIAGRDGQGYAMRAAWPDRCRGRDAASAARGARASSED